MSESDEQETTVAASPKADSRLRRTLVAIGGLAVLYVVGGFFGVPWLVKSQLVQIVEEQLGVTPEIEAVRFNPLDLRLALLGVAVPDPAGGQPVLAFEQLTVDVRLLGFFTADVALEEVLLVGPRISGVVDEGGVLNVSALLATREKRMREAEPAGEAVEIEEEPSEALVVDIGEIRVERGLIRFEDRSQEPTFEFELDPFALDIAGFTTRDSGDSPASLSVRLGTDAELRWEGRVAMDPVRSTGKLELVGFPLRLPWDYVSDQLRFEVKQGELDLSVDYRLDLSDGLVLDLTNGAVAIAEVDLFDREDSKSFLALPSVQVEDIAAVVNKSGLATLGIAAVRIEGGRLASRIEAGGEVHLVEVFSPVESPMTSPEESADAAEKKEPKEAAAEAAAETTEAEKSAEGALAGPSAPVQERTPTPSATTPSSQSAPGPEIRIEQISLSDFDLNFEDRSPARPVPLQLSPLNLVVDGWTNAEGTPFQVALDSGFGEAGQVAVKGPVTLSPLSLALGVEASKIGLGVFQPYLEGVAKLDVTRGSLSTNLDVRLDDKGGGSPEVAVRGRLQIDDWVSLDRRQAKKFVEWKKLSVEGLDYSAAGAKIQEIVLAGAQAHFVVDRAGETNVAAIFSGPREAAPKNAGKTPHSDSSATGTSSDSSLPIEIAKVTLEGLGADLNDLSVEPDFAISLDALEGTIEGLSSAERSRARVNLTGRVNDVAPVRVEGMINPLSGEAFTDIKVRVDGVSLPGFSAYSGRFVGYGIDRGKLSLDLHYELSANHLNAKHFVALNQFGFGSSVDSEDATSLPVKVAAEILKNSKGNIEIRLPVEGDLDDPSFSFLGVLGKTVVNLITRVVTSPLSIVAGLVGASSSDLSQVDFAPGSSTLSPPEAETLAKLAELLRDRKSLQVEIRGRADPEVDGQGADDERTDAAAWRSLARARGAAIQAALLEATEIDAGRVFLLEVDVGPVGQDGSVPSELMLTTK